jgi:hypothetical protein
MAHIHPNLNPNMGISTNGVPQNGWFIMENPKIDYSGVSPF